jgi:hypothetical protein
VVPSESADVTAMAAKVRALIPAAEPGDAE